MRIETRTPNLTQHLHRGQRQRLGKSRSFLDHGRELFQTTFSSSFVSNVDDHSEVLRSKERWDGRFDDVETFFEPGGGSNETREDVELSARCGCVSMACTA